MTKPRHFFNGTTFRLISSHPVRLQLKTGGGRGEEEGNCCVVIPSMTMASLSSSTKAAACRTRPKRRRQEQEEAENLIPAGFLADWLTDPPRRPFKSLLCGAHAPPPGSLSVCLSLRVFFYCSLYLSVALSINFSSASGRCFHFINYVTFFWEHGTITWQNNKANSSNIFYGILIIPTIIAKKLNDAATYQWVLQWLCHHKTVLAFMRSSLNKCT